MTMNFIERLKRLLGGGEHLPAGHENGGEECSAGQPITCMEALEKVYEYLDGELDEDTQRDVGHHFSVCQKCYPHLMLEERFLDLLHQSRGEEKAPPHLKEQVLELLAAEAGEVN